MENKKILIGGIVVVLIALGAWMLFGQAKGGADILADSARIYTYEIENASTDFGFIEVDFKKDSEGLLYANGFVDANKDGIFADDEWVIKNNHASVKKGYKNRFSFALAENLKTNAAENIPVRFSLTLVKITAPEEISEKDAKVFDAAREVVVIDDEFGLNVPGASEDLKRGINVAYANGGHDFELEVEGEVPDLTGGPMDCFAIATANNLIKMTGQNGRRGDLPENPQDMIDELKQDMKWQNGIITRNFMPGKAAFVQRYNLPIETREIKRPTIEDLEDAFSNGDAVEISTTMLRSRSGKANTGHVLTGVGAYQDGDESGISVHDPATPNGADSYELSMTGGANPFLMINYPMWDGIVIIDAIYIQTWTAPQTTGTEKSSTGAEKSSTGAAVPPKAQTPETSQGLKVCGGIFGACEYKIEGTFAHVKPGEYSEIYSVATGLKPGEEIEVWLYDQSGQGRKKSGVADDNGTVHMTWRITSFGNYRLNFQAPNGTPQETTVVVK